MWMWIKPTDILQDSPMLIADIVAAPAPEEVAVTAMSIVEEPISISPRV